MQTIRPKSGQTFTGNGTVLSGARLLTAFTRSGSAWVASGQTQQGVRGGTEADQTCLPGYPRCGYPEDLFFNNLPLRHVGDRSAGGSGRWYFDYEADQIYLWDDPTGAVVETSVTATAFEGYASNVTLRWLVIEKYAAASRTAAVELGPGWTIEDTYVRLNHFAGIATNTNSIAQRNAVHHNGGLGFQGSGTGTLVEGNEMSYNGWAGYNPYWAAGGSKWVFTENLVVRGNFAHHNLGPGLWADIDNIFALFENNVVEDNLRGGIFDELGYHTTIRSNTVRRNGTLKPYPYWTTGAGIEIMGSHDVEVYGNYLEDNWQGITGTEDHRGSGRYGLWALRNLSVHDNTVVSRIAEPGGGRTGIVDNQGTAAYSANNRFFQNRYVLGPQAAYFIWLGDQDESGWKGHGQDIAGMFSR